MSSIWVTSVPSDLNILRAFAGRERVLTASSRSFSREMRRYRRDSERGYSLRAIITLNPLMERSWIPPRGDIVGDVTGDTGSAVSLVIGVSGSLSSGEETCASESLI